MHLLSKNETALNVQHSSLPPRSFKIARFEPDKKKPLNYVDVWETSIRLASQLCAFDFEESYTWASTLNEGTFLRLVPKQASVQSKVRKALWTLVRIGERFYGASAYFAWAGVATLQIPERKWRPRTEVPMITF